MQREVPNIFSSPNIRSSLLSSFKAWLSITETACKVYFFPLVTKLIDATMSGSTFSAASWRMLLFAKGASVLSCHWLRDFKWYIHCEFIRYPCVASRYPNRDIRHLNQHLRKSVCARCSFQYFPVEYFVKWLHSVPPGNYSHDMEIESSRRRMRSKLQINFPGTRLNFTAEFTGNKRCKWIMY